MPIFGVFQFVALAIISKFKIYSRRFMQNHSDNFLHFYSFDEHLDNEHIKYLAVYAIHAKRLSATLLICITMYSVYLHNTITMHTIQSTQYTYRIQYTINNVYSTIYTIQCIQCNTFYIPSSQDNRYRPQTPPTN